MLDHSLLVAQMSRHMRGSRSQSHISRRLGFDSNVVYAWEAGLRAPPLSTFFRYAAAMGIPVGERLALFFAKDSLEPDVLAQTDWAEVGAGAALVRVLFSGSSASKVARVLEVSRHTTGRWLDGRTEPRLTDFLKMVELCSRRLLEFVGLFVDPAELPVTAAEFAIVVAQRELAYCLPWSHVVLRLLETRDGADAKTCVADFAQLLGLTPSVVQDAIEKMDQARLIRLEEGRWVIGDVRTIDTGTEPERNQQLKRHWTEVALARLRDGKEGLFAYNLFAIPAADYERIRLLQIAHFEEVRRIVSESKNPDMVALLNIHLVPLASPPQEA